MSLSNTISWEPKPELPGMCPMYVEPEPKAVLCPVCSGAGKFYVQQNSITAPIPQRCHGCNGKGWVRV